MLGNRSLRSLPSFLSYKHRSRVIEELLQRSSHAKRHSGLTVGVGYVYLKYDDKAKQRVSSVIKSLIVQLVYQLDTLPSNLESAFNNQSRGEPTVASLTRLILEFSPQFYKVFIIFDALDDFGKEQRDKLIPHLQKFLQSGLKVYFSTRPELEGLRITDKKVRIKVISAQKPDITLFIDKRLDEADWEHNLDENERNMIKEKILSGETETYVSILITIISKRLL